jgi:hypothetical protein
MRPEDYPVPKTEMDMADDIRAVQGQIHHWMDQIERGIEVTDTSACSPASLRHHNLRLTMMKHVHRLVSPLLQMALENLTKSHIHQSSREETLRYVVRLCTDIRALEAADWVEAVGRCTPVGTCQISIGSSSHQDVRHMGTGLKKWLGGGSGGSSCGVPLETEMEKKAQMCRTCMHRYGTRIALVEPSI